MQAGGTVVIENGTIIVDSPRESCVFAMGGNVTITADAHEAKALTFGFEEAAAQLKELGYTRVLVLGKDGFASCEL